MKGVIKQYVIGCVCIGICFAFCKSIMKKIKHTTVSIFLVFTLAFSGTAFTDEKTECVILLHGLARTDNSFNRLAGILEKRGYHVVNVDYPSCKKNIETLANETISHGIKECMKARPSKIHFVTHSMGGILVRQYLASKRINNLGRVVMLSPPNQGSEVVDALKDLKIYKWIGGPAGQQLGTGENSVPNKIGPADYDVGIITGDRTINPFLSIIIPGKDDGKVSVKRAKLSGMKDFMVVHKSHPFIMTDRDTIKQIIYYIENGVFYRGQPETES